jgi:hypothetical protein
MSFHRTFLSFNPITAATVFTCATLAASATTQIDRWSTDGGAWDDTVQTGWVSSNLLNPDTSADSGASLHVSERPTATSLAPTGGLYDTFYYTFSTTPTFTLSTDKVLSDLTTVTFDFSYSAGLTNVEAIGLTLNFNASHTSLTADSLTVGSSETINTTFGEQTFTNYSFTWNVLGLGTTDTLSISWNLGQHNAFNGVTLTQASAVPEPAAFAAFAGLGVLVLALIRRRRSV